MSTQAWDKHAEDEANALATMLATQGKRVLVIVIAAHDDEVGTTSVLHAVAGKTQGKHLRQFIAGVERKLAWLNSKLHRRA